MAPVFLIEGEGRRNIDIVNSLYQLYFTKPYFLSAFKLQINTKKKKKKGYISMNIKLFTMYKASMADLWAM